MGCRTCAGDGAMVSHETAAEVHGIIDKPRSATIHITVPLRRRPAPKRPIRGIVIHRSDQSKQQFLGPFNLPRTSIEDTVLDLVAVSPTFDRAYAWITRGVSRKRVTVSVLRTALASRRRIRWREWLDDAFEDAHDGVDSPLERRYVRDVERAHGLPKSQRQARREFGGKVALPGQLVCRVPARGRNRRPRLPRERASAGGQGPRQPQPGDGRRQDVPVRPGRSHRARL